LGSKFCFSIFVFNDNPLSIPSIGFMFTVFVRNWSPVRLSIPSIGFFETLPMPVGRRGDLSIPSIGFVMWLKGSVYFAFRNFQFPLLGSFKHMLLYFLIYFVYAFQFPLLGSTHVEYVPAIGSRIIFQFPLLGSQWPFHHKPTY